MSLSSTLQPWPPTRSTETVQRGRLVIPIATPGPVIQGSHNICKKPPSSIPPCVQVHPGWSPCPPSSETANGKPHYLLPYQIVLAMQPPLCHTEGLPQLCPVITVLPGDHFLILQKICQEYPHLWACPVLLQRLSMVSYDFRRS